MMTAGIILFRKMSKQKLRWIGKKVVHLASEISPSVVRHEIEAWISRASSKRCEIRVLSRMGTKIIPELSGTHRSSLSRGWLLEG
jgi:hypothetical protein